MGQCGIDIVQLSGDKGCDSCPRVGVLEQCNGLITGSVRRKNATTPLVSGVLLVGRLHCKEMRSLTSPARRTQRHQKYKCGANLNHCSCPLRPSPPTPEVVLSASKEPLLSPGAAPSAPISTSPNSHPAPLGRVRHPGRDPTCTIDALPGEGRDLLTALGESADGEWHASGMWLTSEYTSGVHPRIVNAPKAWLTLLHA